MTQEIPSIVDDPRSSSALRSALERARADGPGASELDALLAAVTGSGPASGTPAPSGGAGGAGVAASAGAKLGALALLSGALLLGAGALLDESPSTPPPKSQLAPTPATPHETESRAPIPTVPAPAAPERAPKKAEAIVSEAQPSKRNAQRLAPAPIDVKVESKLEPGSTAVDGRSSERQGANSAVTEKVSTELELLTEAERLLASDSAGALKLTESHRRRFPAGRLAEEREVIAIEALARLGQQARAVQRFALFEHHFGASVHRPRLQQLLGLGQSRSQ